MKVSIITPCYNAESFIQSTIQSVQKQTLTDWEYLLVDDGSTDRSADIIREIASTDNRIKLIQKENGGSASARKLGLSLAQGEYIQFLDADDTIDVNKLERQVNLMNQKGLDVSYCDWRLVYLDGHKDDVKGLNCNLIRLLSVWGTFGTLPPHCFLYKREFLTQNNITIPTQIREREDWDFHIEVFSARPKIERLKGYCGAFYTKAPTGKTTGATQEKIQIGTLKFLLYKINNLSISKKVLFHLRFSIEYCLWILRKIKYRTTTSLLHHPYFRANHDFWQALIIGVFMCPIAIIIIFIRFIVTRCKLTHSI